MGWLAVVPPLISLVYFVWQLGNYASWRQAVSVDVDFPLSEFPTVAIIVPFRNELPNLPRLLTGLERQDYPRDRSTLVLVDDHSTDGGPAWVARHFSTLGGAAGAKLIRLAEFPDLAATVAHKKAAISLAISLSLADVIITTDADCSWPPTVLPNLARQFSAGADVVLGPVLIAPARDWCEGFQALDLAGYQLLTGACLAAGAPALANGANFAFRREVFAEVNGYAGVDHLPSGDDVLLLHKFVNHTRLLRFAYAGSSSARVTTRPVAGWRALWQQRLRWAGKAGNYASPVLTRAQTLTFLTSLAILVGLVWGYFDSLFLYAALVAWGIKAAVDWKLLGAVTRHYDSGSDMRWYWPTQLVYPFYLVAIGLAALLGVKAKWKGR